mmetsp:Transcript_119025/g.336614  ORF Transcript_119025/g.336614 Transcript_119025/m.336614 type:complete len:202 (-) Transcript_119025:1261-1866(-)
MVRPSSSRMTGRSGSSGRPSQRARHLPLLQVPLSRTSERASLLGATTSSSGRLAHGTATTLAQCGRGGARARNSRGALTRCSLGAVPQRATISDKVWLSGTTWRSSAHPVTRHSRGWLTCFRGPVVHGCLSRRSRRMMWLRIVISAIAWRFRTTSRSSERPCATSAVVLHSSSRARVALGRWRPNSWAAPFWRTMNLATKW